MPDDPPSRIDIITRQRREVLGPSIDALVREIDARLPAAERPAFAALIDAADPDGDGDALFHRLTAMRARLGPPPLPAGQPAGTATAAVAGLVVGAVLGLPAGFLLYMVARATLLPTSLWSSDAPMWAIIAATMAGGGLLGATQGGRPTRLGRALLRGAVGFVLGAIGGAILGVVVAGAIGAALDVSQREGAFAMGVAFGVMPLAGVSGGVLMGFWMGRRAWRQWGRA
ncbi:hypothetical protein ACQW02_24130 [Humitalea sp. 24SJ18S-53]|uniref:hypothetical protein n=1 Tax=Humitalea sp. 24SJ18S-53 TaxID=3422307 RepID=UPI003D6794FA